MSENICTKCGIIKYNTPETSTEEFELTDEIKKNCIVPKPARLDFSNGGFLSTVIDKKNVDFIGKKVNSALFNKIRCASNYIASSQGLSTFHHGMWMIASFANRLYLPPITKERAAELFNLIYQQKTNIHNSTNIVCACLYYAIKEAGIDRKPVDIATVAQKDNPADYASEIFNTYQNLIQELNLPSPKYYGTVREIDHLGSKMGLNQKVIRYAIEIYQEVKAKDKIYFIGKSARLIATILLYISASIFQRNDELVDEDVFASVADITTYILRKRVNDYLNHENFKKYRDQMTIIN